MKNIARSAVALILAVCAVTGFTAGTQAKEEKPSKLPEKAAPVTGVLVYQNEKAKVDASNQAEGYALVSYHGGKDVRIKVLIRKQDGVTYTYDLNNKGAAETFPFTEGDGAYTVGVFENIVGTRYAQAYSCTVNVTLRNNFLPFLYPNQYVNFTMESETAKKAAELGGEGDLDIVSRIYAFVTDNLTYDTELAKTVKSGYLPDVDAVLAKGKGICFDYSALMAAMLRSRNIPCKLVVGYVGQAYHAWLNVYIDGIGWVDKLIYFDGENWKLFDPTFASALGTNSDRLKKYVGDGSNYLEKYAY